MFFWTGFRRPRILEGSGGSRVVDARHRSELDRWLTPDRLDQLNAMTGDVECRWLRRELHLKVYEDGHPADAEAVITVVRRAVAEAKALIGDIR